MGFPPSVNRVVTQSIPEHSPVNGNMHHTPQTQAWDKPSHLSLSSNADLPRQQSVDSFRSSYGAASSSGGDSRASALSANDGSSIGSPILGQAGAPVTPATPRDSAVESLPVITQDDDGLIPVETEGPNSKPALPGIARRDTSVTLASSFYQLKGFCEGAKEVLRGELGVKKVKKPSFSGSQLTAKCTHCFYELDWKEIEMDINHSGKCSVFYPPSE